MYMCVCAVGELIEKSMLKEQHQSTTLNEPYLKANANKPINKQTKKKHLKGSWGKVDTDWIFDDIKGLFISSSVIMIWPLCLKKKAILIFLRYILQYL